MSNTSIQSAGGKACLKRHGRTHFKSISDAYWKSPAGIARKRKMRKGKVKA